MNPLQLMHTELRIRQKNDDRGLLAGSGRNPRL